MDFGLKDESYLAPPDGYMEDEFEEETKGEDEADFILACLNLRTMSSHSLPKRQKDLLRAKWPGIPLDEDEIAAVKLEYPEWNGKR